MVLIFISSGNVLDILLGEPVLCQFVSGWETMQSSDHDLPFAIHCDKTLYLWSFWMLGTFLSNQKCLMQFGDFYLGYPIEIKTLKFCMWRWLMHFNFVFFFFTGFNVFSWMFVGGLNILSIGFISFFIFLFFSFFLMVTGPETLLRQSSDLGGSVRGEGFFEGDIGDAIEAHEWKCVRTLNGTFLLTFLYLLERPLWHNFF